MAIMSPLKSDQLCLKFRRKTIFKKQDDVKVKASNEEVTAIENLMARYIYALAYYKEKDFMAKSWLKYFLIQPGLE